MNWLLIVMVLFEAGVISTKPMHFPSLHACEIMKARLIPPESVQREAEGWIAECIEIQTLKGIDT